MAGGTDYSKPASDQGFSKTDLIAAAEATAPTTTIKTLRKRKVARHPCGKTKKSNRSLAQAIKQAHIITQYYALEHINPDVGDFT